jgi:hypothetical protein
MRKQNICIYKDTKCITMHNVGVIIINKPIYWSALQQLRDKLQALTGERKNINTEEVNKQKQRWREKYKERNNKERI